MKALNIKEDGGADTKALCLLFENRATTQYNFLRCRQPLLEVQISIWNIINSQLIRKVINLVDIKK